MTTRSEQLVDVTIDNFVHFWKCIKQHKLGVEISGGRSGYNFLYSIDPENVRSVRHGRLGVDYFTKAGAVKYFNESKDVYEDCFVAFAALLRERDRVRKKRCSDRQRARMSQPSAFADFEMEDMENTSRRSKGKRGRMRARGTAKTQTRPTKRQAPARARAGSKPKPVPVPESQAQPRLKPDRTDKFCKWGEGRKAVLGAAIQLLRKGEVATSTTLFEVLGIRVEELTVSC